MKYYVHQNFKTNKTKVILQCKQYLMEYLFALRTDEKLMQKSTMIFHSQHPLLWLRSGQQKKNNRLKNAFVNRKIVSHCMVVCTSQSCEYVFLSPPLIGPPSFAPSFSKVFKNKEKI